MQLARSESASAGSGFSWNPWTRPSEPVTTTPYSAVFVTRLTARVASQSCSAWVRASAARSMSVSASPAMTTNAPEPKNSRTLRTPPAVPSNRSS